MFDNSVSVISNISRSIKKYLFILGIITQCLFIAYYAYLIVVNINTIHLLVPYCFVAFFALVMLFIDIFTVDITSFKTKIFKTTFKRVLTGISWLFKAAVISYNIYITVSFPQTEAGVLFLIFSSIFLIVQILSSLIGWLFSYYSELFVYALKMDYENIIDENEDPEQKPIGHALNQFTNQKDYKNKVNELAIKHELFGSIKNEIEKDNSIRLNGRLIKRKKAERIILQYYRKATKFYKSRIKTKLLLEKIDHDLSNYINNHDKAYLLEFFLINYYDQVYVGLSEHAIILIIACYLYMLDNHSKDMVNVTFKALLKEIVDIKTWSMPNPKAVELSRSNVASSRYDRVLSIAKETKTQYELYKAETIGSEFESLIVKVIKDGVIENGKITIRRKLRSFFGKDK